MPDASNYNGTPRSTGFAGPIPEIWSARDVKLTAPSYLILGMLRLGIRSGYGIKKAADVSTKHFWPMSLAKVYPELASLEDAGLIVRSDDPHGARSRHSYEPTEGIARMAGFPSRRSAPCP